MVIRDHEMSIEKKEKMRSGEGVVEIKHLVNKDKLKNARLLAHLTIPISASIGEHEHNNETEYFIILKGKGIVNDDGEEKEVLPGDVIITGNGAKHSIKNISNENLEMIAVIILD
jgi:mannose-6-phosphate isomerase-like protein (cupin superfamily)